jgi:regulator of nucleoside diphosphate kinase
MLEYMSTRESDARPRIILSKAESDRLADLAVAVFGSMPAIAKALIDEVNRADVVAPHRLPSDAVAMHSVVEFRDDVTGRVRTVQIVYPQYADISVDKVSILTPIGVALIGLSAGQSTIWQGRDGITRRLTVLQVGRGRASAERNDETIR